MNDVWRFKPDFTLWEISCFMAGFSPDDPADSVTVKQRATQYRWHQILMEEINSDRVYGLPPWIYSPAGVYVFESGSDPAARGTGKVSRKGLLKWCNSKGITIPAIFPEQQIETVPATPRPGGYSTEYLELMDDAIAHFWKDYDPVKLESRQPGKQEVVGWLQAKSPGLSDKLASAIETIICPFDRRGGNKKLG